MKPTRNLLLLSAGLAALSASAGWSAEPPRNLYAPYPDVSDRGKDIAWPEGQALPTFATPAETLDTIVVQDLSPDERLTFSALQGQVNRTKPRILLLNARAEEGRDTWPKTETLGLGELEFHARPKRWELLAKYAPEVEGVVLYNPELSPHYRNLAGTAAGLRRAIPATAEVFAEMKENGIELEIVEDFTQLEFTTPLEIYGHLLERYWPDCTKRVIVSARPDDRGDLHHTRDIAAACGAAVVWLDTLDPAERDLLRKFFADMTAGEAIALGWYRTERSGITAASEFGIGTMPADFYLSGSVYSGTPHRIEIPAVPKMPELEDKIYVAMFISDGDNIQYTQHAMRRIWDANAEVRGKVPLNWTIAPGLVDIGPGILNYYYTTATPNDCFVTGPSGMGYLMPVNTLEEPGAPVGVFLKDEERMNGYARLTETYLQRSGLRVVTIWDEATPMHRAAYEKHGRNLYGVTVQNFRDMPSVESSVVGDRVRFDKLVIPYAGSYEHIHRSLSRNIRRWNGRGPMFLSYQMDVWHEMKPNRIVELHENLQKEHPGKVEFVRADHYFNLFNQANGLPYNLSMDPATTVRTSDDSETAAQLTDGTPATLWSADGPAWFGLDFGAPRRVSRGVIRHAGAHGLDDSLNTRGFTLQASADGKAWKDILRITGNTADVSDHEFPAVEARYVKVVIDDPGADGTARVADVEIFGRR